MVQHKDHIYDAPTASDIVMSNLDTAALQYHLQSTLLKRFRENILTIWKDVIDTLESFLDYINQIDSTCYINLIMKV